MFVDLDWPLNASSLLSASAELLVLYLHEGRNYATCELASYVVSYQMPFLGLCKSHQIDLPVQDIQVCPVERSTSWNDLHNSLSDSSGMVPKCLETLWDHTRTVGTLRTMLMAPKCPRPDYRYHRVPSTDILYICHSRLSPEIFNTRQQRIFNSIYLFRFEWKCFLYLPKSGIC